MSTRVSCHAVAVATLLVATLHGNAQAQDSHTVMLKPGLWRVTSQLWLDGKEVLGAIDAAGAQATAEILNDARARMGPIERADFDRNFQLPERQSSQFEMECITPEEAGMSARAALQTALAALQEPPWTCSITNSRRIAQGYAFDYRCRTPANGQADGRARFETRTDRLYRSEIEGRSHLVDMETGRPLNARIVPVRSLTTGYWHAEDCQP